MRKQEFKEGTIYSAVRGPYNWLTSTEQYMGAIVQLCPDAILGRFLTVTAIDAGTPWLTDAQQAAGWQLAGGMAHSQRVSAIEELFYQRDGEDCPGWDEWYLFDEQPRHMGEVHTGNPFESGNEPRPGRVVQFVGWYTDFVLHKPDADQTINEMFWRQMDWIQPAVYISDGRDNLTFVSSDQLLFESVLDRLGKALGQ